MKQIRYNEAANILRLEFPAEWDGELVTAVTLTVKDRDGEVLLPAQSVTLYTQTTLDEAAARFSRTITLASGAEDLEPGDHILITGAAGNEKHVVEGYDSTTREVSLEKMLEKAHDAADEVHGLFGTYSLDTSGTDWVSAASFDYNAVAEYTLSDDTKITVDDSDNNKATLVPITGNINDWPFTTGTNYTFDDTVIEIAAGKAQLKDVTPSDATFHANFAADINGNWGDGTLTGTATGGAAVSGGKLDLNYDDVRYVSYDPVSNADSQQVGCIRLKMTPNYSGSPSNPMTLFSINKASGDSVNLMFLRHQSNGQFQLLIKSATDTVIVSNSSFGAWSPTSSIEYEFELNWDLTTGATRLFIDGVQFGSTETGTGTRDANIGFFAVGSNYNGVDPSNFSIDDLIIFPTVQHTSNYTPGGSIPVTVPYATTDPDIVPDTGFAFSYALHQFTETATKPAGTAIAYQVSSDDGVTWKWWSGSSWDAITAAQTDSWYYANEANSAADINTNIASLAASGTFKYRAFLHSDDATARPLLDNIQACEPGTFYSTTDDLYIDTTDDSQIATRFIQDWLTAVITSTLPANTDAKVMFSTDDRSSWLTWDGSAWSAPASATARANATSLTDAATNFTTLALGSATLDARLFLYTSDRLETPEVDNIAVGSEITGFFSYYPEGIVIVLLWTPTGDGNPITEMAQLAVSSLEMVGMRQQFDDVYPRAFNAFTVPVDKFDRMAEIAERQVGNILRQGHLDIQRVVDQSELIDCIMARMAMLWALNGDEDMEDERKALSNEFNMHLASVQSLPIWTDDNQDGSEDEEEVTSHEHEFGKGW